ncbi:MAG: transposase, partial [bacterium]
VFESCWEQRLLETGTVKRVKKSRLIMSEIMTIVIYFHFSKFRTFKDYYVNFICGSHHSAFPNLVSYNRFVELSQGVIVPLLFYLQTQRLGKITGISFIDSPPLEVCHPRRIHSHRVLKGSA